MKTIHPVSRILYAATFLLLAVPTFAQNNLLPEGTFEVVTEGRPSGWDAWTPANTKVIGEAGNRWLKLSSTAVGESAIVAKQIKLDPNKKLLVVSVRMKTTGLKLNPAVDWNEARVAMRFLNDKNEQVGAYPSMPSLRADSAWVMKESVLDVPEGATQLQLQPGLWGVAGTLELDDLAVTAYAERTAWARRNVLPLRAGLPEGKFEDATLAGWADAKNPHIKTVDSGGSRALQITQQDTASITSSNVTFSLDPKWAEINVKARFRAQNLKLGPDGWHDEPWRQAGVHVSFLDGQGTEIKGANSLLTRTDTDWKEFTSKSVIPEGAAFVRLAPGLYQTSGLLEVDDIAVEGVTEPTLANAQLPENEKLTWGEEPVENLGAKRAQIVLNGLWRFLPATGEARDNPTNGWGYIRVPGSWKQSELPGVVAKGQGRMWQVFDGDKVNEAWYEREFTLPTAWTGRTVELDLSRVSTDAVVYVNGTRCGEVRWPMGTVDITKRLKPGLNTLRIWVLASNANQEVLSSSHSMSQGLARETVDVPTKGIIGDVLLSSRPRGTYLGDVFVQPSVRKKQLALDVEVMGVAKAGTVQFVAKMLNEKGIEEKRFTGTARVKPGTQLVRLSWPWSGARLWDVAQPNLYTLRLEARGAGLDDEYSQEFGFREFWIEGRKIFLNNKEIRLRTDTAPISGVVAENDGRTRGLLWAGFNFAENWPTDVDARGSINWDDLWASSADRSGLLTSSRLPSLMRYILGEGWTYIGDQDNNMEKWLSRAQMIVRRQRNHPSVVMWGHTANFFADSQDQNPRVMGRTTAPLTGTDTGTRARLAGKRANAMVKQLDPTRAVITHAGSDISDIYTVNNYLNMIPLQEREEWLSDWAVNGNLPYMAVEFGTPLFTSLLRGRAPYGQDSLGSEPWQTEFSAIYFGNDAYKNEPLDYRKDIAARFQRDQSYKFHWGQDRPLQIYNPAMQKLQTLFVRNTWRSWRTMGLTGGLVPWERHGWKMPVDYGYTKLKTDVGPFRAGTRGVYKREILKREAEEFLLPQEGGTVIYPSGQALLETNRPTLAWIAGPTPQGKEDVASFTAKDHSYKPGETIQKSLVLINDTRAEQPYSATWRITVDGQTVSNGSKNGKIAVAQNLFVPILFNAPAIASDKADGEIRMTATIGGVAHEDSFAFRVLSPPVPSRGTLVAFDPAGKTTKLLQSMGYTVSPWNGASIDSFLVIGREALSGGHRLPGDVEAFVRNGGRAMVFGQHPDWLRENLGLRVAEFPARRVFPVSSTHAVMQGLDAQDLRDWRGESTLIDPRPTYTGAEPRHGWHWGNRGAVSSAAVEKPHLSSWRPILETEFDLQYSPLMELDLGRGRLILNTLDLEEHAPLDVAAARLASNVMSYAITAPLTSKAQNVLYLGGDAGAKQLDEMGVINQKATLITPNAELVIIGADANPDAASLNTYLQNGGKVFYMPRATAGKVGSGTQSVTLASVADFGGASEIPDWPEARGLSLSDLHLKVPTTMLLATGGQPSVGIGDGGALARMAVGKGVAVLAQTDPNALDADKKTYYRFTRWRQTRTLAQVLSNMGATFKSDTRFFHPEPERVWITGTWRIKSTKLITPVGQERTKDEGMTNEAKAAMNAEVDDSTWDKIEMPSMWNTLETMNGEVVTRRVIDVPESWAGQDLVVSLGRVDDFDDTYWNGELIGTTHNWEPQREYTIPGRLVKAGRNVISVRIFDNFGGGGFGGQADQLFIRRKVVNAPPFYHTDYRTDYKWGDNPYRYFRW